MALRSPQYIFGDFSPDEFNQFFVTPRSSVELPPYGGAVLCDGRAAEEPPDGQDYQRIEFGVNEVIEPSAALPRAPGCGVSSTLNPQAPEFILGCPASSKTLEGTDKEASHSTVDCQHPGPAPALGHGSHVEADASENDGGPGGLGQRERKKKKKRPPGYYSYLRDGGDDSIPTGALLNGHANSTPPNSVGTEDAEFLDDMLPCVPSRTCHSPRDSTDSVSDTVLDGEPRTAGQPEGVQGTEVEQSCLPVETGREGLLRTAVVQPHVGTDTTENLGVANGQILESSGEVPAANGVEVHTVGDTDSDTAKPESASSLPTAPCLRQAPLLSASPPSPGPASFTTLSPRPPRLWPMWKPSIPLLPRPPGVRKAGGSQRGGGSGIRGPRSHEDRRVTGECDADP